MDQNLVDRVQMLHAESELVEERISFIDKQVTELSEFLGHLSFIEASSQNELVSSLGKGIFIRSVLSSKEIMVDVGAGVLVKKSGPEVQKIIQSQLENLARMRGESQHQLATLQREFETIITRIESAQPELRKTI